MSNSPYPILYSFRRCPYAMRARLALCASRQFCELREVELKNKPDEMLEASPKGTVPVLALPNGQVIDESLDIMLWALQCSDPEGSLRPQEGTLTEMLLLIGRSDTDFKYHLDRYKYAPRYEGADPLEHRAQAEHFLARLERRLSNKPFLFGQFPALADWAIAPFVRQFANVDREWFYSTPYKNLQEWLDTFLATPHFAAVMNKYAPWQKGDPATFFGDDAELPQEA